MQFNKLTRWDNYTTVIGALEWREGPGRTFEVHIDVDPAYQRKGIGRSLIAELERAISDLEPMSLYTFMAADNAKARLFFTGVGFTLYYVKDFYGEGRDAWFGCKAIGRPK